MYYQQDSFFENYTTISTTEKNTTEDPTWESLNSAAKIAIISIVATTIFIIMAVVLIQFVKWIRYYWICGTIPLMTEIVPDHYSSFRDEGDTHQPDILTFREEQATTIDQHQPDISIIEMTAIDRMIARQQAATRRTPLVNSSRPQPSFLPVNNHSRPVGSDLPPAYEDALVDQSMQFELDNAIANCPPPSYYNSTIIYNTHTQERNVYR